MEDNKHNHKKISIKNEIQNRMSEWTSLSERVKKLESIIDTSYKPHKPLIKYLDNENLLQEPGMNIQFPAYNVSQDIVNFRDILIKINKNVVELEKLEEKKEI